MTGTASEFLSESENINSDQYSFNLLSSWLFGKINVNCILQQIDYNGCIILVPTSQKILVPKIKLIFMSHDSPERVDTIIDAYVLRADDKSSEYHRVELSFTDLDDGIRGEINLLRTRINRVAQDQVKCSIINA